MSSYYDDEEFGPIYRERDEAALTAVIEEHEREAPVCVCAQQPGGCDPWCKACTPAICQARS